MVRFEERLDFFATSAVERCRTLSVTFPPEKAATHTLSERTSLARTNIRHEQKRLAEE
jgi:hypothetical protein